MHINETPLPPSATIKNVPPQLESIILRCLEKDPPDRFQSASEIKTGLDILLSQLRETRKRDAERPPKQPSTPILNVPSKGNHLRLIAISLVGITALAICLFRFAPPGSNESSKQKVEGGSPAAGSNETAKQKVERLLAEGKQLEEKSKSSEAIQPLMEADSICDRNFPNDEIRAKVDFYLAEAQASTPGDETNAVKTYTRAAELYAKYHEEMEFRNACMNAGCDLSDQRNYVGADEFFKKAVENADRNDLKRTDPESYVNIVTMFAVNTARIQGHEKEAAQLFDTGLKASRDSRVTTLTKLRSLRDAIGFYISTHDYPRAKQLMHEVGTIKITHEQAQTGDFVAIEGQLAEFRQQLSMPN
jgi:tetratricopeptide (TPR) repeat protein